jgi:purine nucleoside phosphorylase
MPSRTSDDGSGFAAKVDQAEAWLRSRRISEAAVGIILGTGLGALAGEVTGATSVRYDDIPHFPRATAIGHKGQLTFGQLGDTPVLVMEGRFHRGSILTKARAALHWRCQFMCFIGSACDF